MEISDLSPWKIFLPLNQIDFLIRCKILLLDQLSTYHDCCLLLTMAVSVMCPCWSDHWAVLVLTAVSGLAARDSVQSRDGSTGLLHARPHVTPR